MWIRKRYTIGRRPPPVMVEETCKRYCCTSQSADGHNRTPQRHSHGTSNIQGQQQRTDDSHEKSKPGTDEQKIQDDDDAYRASPSPRVQARQYNRMSSSGNAEYEGFGIPMSASICARVRKTHGITKS